MNPIVKILIVDDEYHIREGIKTSVPWSRIGIGGIDEAADGMQALERYERQRPDIVLLDINIPKMDGMEVARRIRKAGGTARIIFLTGYDDFPKAKEAIALHATDYLVKPVEYAELVSAVERACEQIMADRRTVLRIDQMKRQMEGFKAAAAERLLIDWLEHRRTFEEIEAVAAEFGIERGKSRLYGFLCADIDGYEQRIAGAADRDRQLYLFAYRKIAQEVLHDTASGCGGSVLSLSSGKLLLLVYCDVPAGARSALSSAEPLMPALARRLQDAYKTYLRWSVSIGMSEWSGDVRSLGELYADAIQAVNYRSVVGCGAIIPASMVEPSGAIRQRLMNKELFLLEELNAGTELRSAASWNRWLEELSALPLADAKLVASQFAVNALRLGKEAADEAAVPDEAAAIPGHIAACQTMQDLIGHLNGLIDSVAHRLRSARSPAASKIVEQAKRWIRERLHEEISLQAVADALHVNPYYLSRLFRQATNETYLEYTTRLRFERARELLVHTQLKMHEIAERVGFKDANYFSIAFKKFEGVNPTEYRKRYQ